MIYKIIIGYVISTCLLIIILDFISQHKSNKKNKTEKHIKNDSYTTTIPQFKVLTQEQIDDIHSRGKITPKEKVKEWEDMDLCAPGDAIGSAAWRCRKFKNCHDCLVDYANQHDEYVSFFDILKECEPFKL